MIAEIATLLLATALGIALARRFNGQANDALLVGEGVLFGIGTMAAILLVLFLFGASWAWIALAAIVIGGVAARTASWPGSFHRLRVSPFDLVTLVCLAGYARLATMAPLWEFDYIGDFGLKGRVFFEARSIDWNFLRSAFMGEHPDYPPLVPLSFDLLALSRGAWNDWTHGLLNIAFALALLLVMRHLALEETKSLHGAAFIAAAMLPLAASPWIGLAEGPFVAFGTTALLLIRRRSVTPGAVMLGFAALSKNEGLALIVAVAVGLAVARRWRDVARLWPSLVMPLPWLVLRNVHHLRNDLAEGSVAARIVEHLRDPRPLLHAFATFNAGRPLFWLALAAGIALVIRPLLARERFVLVVLAVQFLVYLGAYLATPHDVFWHVRWSAERLISHLSPALTYVVLTQLLTPFDSLPRP